MDVHAFTGMHTQNYMCTDGRTDRLADLLTYLLYYIYLLTAADSVVPFQCL